MAEGGKVIWFEIYVANIERAKGFYGGMFGWSFTPLSDYDPENYWLIQGSDEGTVAGALVQMPGRPTPSEWSVVLYVNVNHLEDAVESATRLGGKLIQSRTLISETAGSFAIVRDTEGNHLGLWVE